MNKEIKKLEKVSALCTDVKLLYLTKENLRKAMRVKPFREITSSDFYMKMVDYYAADEVIFRGGKKRIVFKDKYCLFKRKEMRV